MQIQRADVNAYGLGSERSIPKLSYKLKPKPGRQAELYHEVKIKGATEPLSLYLSCSPASSGMLMFKEIVLFISTFVNVSKYIMSF